MFSLSTLHELQRELVPSHTDTADVISSIVVAITMMKHFCRHLKYIKNIFLLTNGRYAKPLDEVDGDLEAIKEEMARVGIRFKVLGVDFDDAANSFEEPRGVSDFDPAKKQSEKILSNLCQDLPDAIFANAQEAIRALPWSNLKKTRPVKVFSGKLSIGDITTYPSQNVVSIDVEAFPWTRVAIPPSAASYATLSKSAAIAPSPTDTKETIQLRKQGLQEVKRITEFYCNDENAPDGRIDVEQGLVQSGYKFGSEIVVLSPEEEIVLNMPNKDMASIQIVGFVKEDDVPRQLGMSTTEIIVGLKGLPRDTIALNSITKALYNEKSAAIARVVRKDSKYPEMCILTPFVVEELSQLFMTRLPFSQEVRHYSFPPLGEVRVRDKESDAFKTVKVHPTMIPTEEMQNAMDDLVDDLDMMQGGPMGEEDATPQEILNPLISRIKNFIKNCALTESTDVPDLPEIVTRYSKRPEYLVEKGAKSLAKLESLMATRKLETAEERKDRVKRQKETKLANGGLETKPETRVEEKPIDLEAILANGSNSPANNQLKYEQDNPESSPPPNLDSVLLSSGIPISSRSTTSPSSSSLTGNISTTSPVKDFQVVLSSYSSSPSEINSRQSLQTLGSACQQVVAILFDLFEIALVPNRDIDNTITQLLKMLEVVGLVSAGTTDSKFTSLRQSLKLQFEQALEDGEISSHLVPHVTATAKSL